MTTPALPAGVQNLLDMYSLKAQFVERANTINPPFWRVTRADAPENWIPKRIIIPASALLVDWFLIIGHEHETLKE